MEKDTQRATAFVGKKPAAALFDFDGVIMDTEGQYTQFWCGMGAEYKGDPDFGKRIKGQSLTHIYDAHFAGRDQVQQTITERLYDFERNMRYEYIAGAHEFLQELRREGIPVAVVTSSNNAKMQNVYRAHPELTQLVDKIITSDMFQHSKPAPDCFLLGMRELDAEAKDTVVFEDSHHGLKAGRAAGAFVVGLATTNKREDIEAEADALIDDFTQMSLPRLRRLMAEWRG